MSALFWHSLPLATALSLMSTVVDDSTPVAVWFQKWLYSARVLIRRLSAAGISSGSPLQ
jgi:hypothetical protein